MNGNELTPQQQDQLQQLQQLQQQAQMVINQKSQLEHLAIETDTMLQELEKVPDGTMLSKVVGNIIIPASKEDLLVELKSHKDLIDVRLKTTERQEERIKSRFSQLQERFKSGQE